MCTPVVLFVYNRLEQTKRVIEALNHNRRIEETDLYIYSDAAKDETEVDNVDKVRRYLEYFSKEHNFRNLSIVKAEKNKGLEKSIIEGVSSIINMYGSIIVLEDDIETSPDFLDYMNQALEQYKEDKKIWSISGYTIENNKIRQAKKDVFLGYRAVCWGWASWADRWNKIDWEVKDYPKFLKNKKMQREFNKGGADMTFLLKKQQRGEIKSWAIRWCYQQYKEGMFTIFPRISKVKNIGLDGSGTNCGNVTVKQQEFVMQKSWDFSYEQNNFKLYREFQKYYFVAYMRQVLGYYWYQLLEYEHCIVYKKEKDKAFSVLKSNFKEWYEEPMLWSQDGKEYLFVRIFDRFKEKGSIGICEFYDDKLQKPKKIIEEKNDLSFPFIFVNEKETYLITPDAKTKKIYIYIKGENVYQWKLNSILESEEKLVNIVLLKEKQNLFLLGSKPCLKNKNQSKLVLYHLKNFNDRDSYLEKKWEEKEYSYSTKNGGNIIKENSSLYRIVKNGTKDISGKYITIKKIDKLDDLGVKESFKEKIDLTSKTVSMPSFINRLWGISGYGINDKMEVLDVYIQHFSIAGIVIKICRSITKKKNDRE